MSYVPACPLRGYAAAGLIVSSLDGTKVYCKALGLVARADLAGNSPVIDLAVGAGDPQWAAGVAAHFDGSAAGTVALPAGDYRLRYKGGADAAAIAADWQGDTGAIAYEQLRTYDGTAWTSPESSSAVAAGAFTVAVTVDDGDGNALEGATVRYAQAGVTKWSGPTDADGLADVSVDAGTYTRVVTKDGYNGVTAAGVVVNADAAITVTLPRLAPAAASDPDKCTGYADCYDKDGQPVAGVVVAVRLVDGGGVAGRSYPKGAEVTQTSADGTGDVPLGRVEFVNLVRGATYEVRRGDGGAWVEFTVPADADTLALTEFLGGAAD